MQYEWLDVTWSVHKWQSIHLTEDLAFIYWSQIFYCSSNKTGPKLPPGLQTMHAPSFACCNVKSFLQHWVHQQWSLFLSFATDKLRILSSHFAIIQLQVFIQTWVLPYPLKDYICYLEVYVKTRQNEGGVAGFLSWKAHRNSLSSSSWEA